MRLRNPFRADEAIPSEPIPCAMAACVRPALVRIRAGGWLNLCVYHYEHQNDAAALAYAEKHGLRTPSEHAHHCKSLSIGGGWRIREPGED